MVMANTVKGLRAVSKHIQKAEAVLEGVNVLLESKTIARDLEHLASVQSTIAELVLIAPRLDSYDRACTFQTRVGDIDEQIAMNMSLDEDGIWELLDSKPFNRAIAHLESAADVLGTIDADGEWADENPEDDEDEDASEDEEDE